MHLYISLYVYIHTFIHIYIYINQSISFISSKGHRYYLNTMNTTQFSKKKYSETIYEVHASLNNQS